MRDYFLFIFPVNLLQVFLIVSGVVIFFLWIDVARRQKFNAIHFFVFIFIGVSLLIFSLFPNVLNSLGSIFWLQRWADLLVYSSIIFLLYFSLVLLRKIEQTREDMTLFIRELAIKNSSKKLLFEEVMFVLPVYNEWKVVYNNIKEIINEWYKNIIVVNDWSIDETELELEKLGDSIVLLHHIKNRGQWAALETGFEYVRRYGKWKYVCTFDSDGQHKLSDLKKFLHVMKEHPKTKIIFGSRFLSTAQTNVSLSRRVLLKLAIVFTFFMSQIRLSDTHNGYRLIRREILDNIRITLDGMWHASEIIDIVAFHKIPFREVPVTIEYTEYSRAKWQKNSGALWIAIKFIWSKFFK